MQVNKQGGMTVSGDAWISETEPYLAARSKGQKDAWSDEAASRGHRGSQQLLAVEEVSPPDDVREALHLPPDGTAVVRRRLILLDDQPVELTDSYYPATIARGTRLAEPRKIPGGAVTLLSELGYVGADVIEDVTADVATTEQHAALHLEAGAAVLRLMRVTLSTNDEPMEVAVMTMPPERHLQYRLRKKAG